MPDAGWMAAKAMLQQLPKTFMWSPLQDLMRGDV